MPTYHASDGANLAFTDRGTREGIPLLFVHGWLAGASVWEPLTRHLAPHHRVVTVDLRGFGESNAAPGPYSLERYSTDLSDLVESLDLDPLVVVGHSMGGDITMYFAKMYPDQIKKVVTLDNLRVPFMTDGKFKILSFRSKDPVFKPDPGVIPANDVCEQAGITVVNTGFQHNDMRDTGPDEAKASIQDMLDKFLVDDSPLKSVETKTPPPLTDPGPVALYAPIKD